MEAINTMNGSIFLENSPFNFMVDQKILEGCLTIQQNRQQLSASLSFATQKKLT